MITKGSIVGWGIVILVVLHYLLKEYVFPAMLYLFAFVLFVWGISYLASGLTVYGVAHILGGLILTIALWTK